MRQEISLYLNGREVQFNEPPQILFSYIRTDYTDPTVLRNSYSKTLNIEGTPNNNQIFNSIYHLDKISDYGTFNPAKRMEFQLFSNGDILEQGYAKLDKINKNEKNISYDITLYGGLGEFLYNLSYDQTAEGSDTSRGGGEDRRLSSLIYYDEVEPNKEFDFEITKDTVAEAWEALEKGTGDTKWKYINFAPAYNGYPQEDFDADKVLINTQNSSCPVTYNNNGTTGTTKGFPTSIIQNDTTYRAYNNYAIGELSKEMTEWEMRDLRSYLQRPVLSMKGFINAIKNPANNGGYEVELDSNFFNEDNPYYEKAWFTLPLLKKDEVDTGQSAKTVADNDVLSVGSRLGEDYDVRYYLQGLQAGATYNGVDLTFSLKDTISNMPNEVYTSFADYNIGFFGRDAAYFSSIFVQLVGEDSSGNAIAASPIYNFTSRYGNEKGWWFWSDSRPPTEYCSRSEFTAQYTPDINTQDVNVFGRFVKTSGNNYVWKTDDGNLSAFTISLTDEFEYARVYFRVTKCYHWRDHSTGTDPGNCFEEQIFSGLTNTEGKRRNILGSYANRTLDRCGFAAIGYFNSDTITATTAVTGVEVIGSQVRYTVASDVIRSGDHISKGDLLNFDGTPCDYLLSYCKLFNLYLTKDIYDRKIYIRTRDTFYNGGTIDLDKFIDRSKEIKVNPLAMESRWYDFAYPEDEMCGAAEDYDFNYGVEYGKNKVQTTYEFDSTAVDLFSENIFQNSVQVQESSKFYTLRTVRPLLSVQRKTVPTFLYNTVDYKLFSTPNNSLTSCVIIPPSGYTQTGYTSEDGREDWLPKLQLNNDNQAIDGTNILCFYGGFKTSPYVGSQQAIYYLTDDLAEMYVLNGEKPCWLWTKNEYNASQRIAKGMTKLPIFSRMLYDDSGEKIEYTWDFGRVRNTYVPVKNYVDKATIFERWWADYIADLYNANTRVAEVYVKMEGKVVGDWLRAMYWWDNNYWVLTEINDYNITSYDTTKCKFVRVNDIANYTSSIIPPAPVEPNAVFVPEKYIIDASGETISGYISCTSPDLAWHIEYPSYTSPSVSYGTGNTNLTFTINPNSADDGREFKVGTYILTNPGSPTSFWQEGQETKEKTLSVLSGNRFIFNYQNQSSSLPTINYKNRGTDTITITSDANWISLGTITWNGENASMPFTLTENTGTTVRSATLTISAVSQQLSTTVIIDQLPQSVVLSNNGESKTLTLRNTTYGVNAMDGFWATITTSGNDITFTAPANVEDETRYENVKVEVQGEGFYSSASTQLVQNGGGGQLIVTPTAITAEWSGGDKMIVVQCMSNWSITSAPVWLNITPSTGTSGQSIVIVNFPEYNGESARTGNIVFSDGTRTATTQVTQNANTGTYDLAVTPASIHLNSSGTGQYINIYSPRMNWSVLSKPDWITLSQSSGFIGSSLVVVTASENRELSARTGDIVFADFLNHSATCQVLQDNYSEVNITFSPSELAFDFSGGSTSFSVTADCAYEIVKGSGDWYSVTPSSGYVGSTVFAVTGNSINTGSADWTSNISIVGPNGTAGTISLRQPSQSSTRISYTADTSLVAASGETRIITIDSTDFVNSSITVTLQNPSQATYTYEQTSLTRGTVTVNILENTGSLRDVSVIITGRRALSSTMASAVVTFPQAQYITVPIPYTADTSDVAGSGETRTIIIDASNLVASSITATVSGAPGVTTTYNNGVFTITFPQNNSLSSRTVTVTITGKTTDNNLGSATVTYNQLAGISYATAITLNAPFSMAVGYTGQTTVTVTPSTATTNLYYTSSNNSIATINNSGVISAISSGQVSVCVYDRNSGLQDCKSITVIQPTVIATAITLNVPSRVYQNYTEEATVTTSPANATTDLVFSSSDSSVATVNSGTGLITGVGTGQTNICVYDNISQLQDCKTITVIEGGVLNEYLTFEIISGGTINWIDVYNEKPIQYNLNNSRWIQIVGTQSISVSSGDIIYFRGDNRGYGSSVGASFSGSTCTFKVRGNIMSLIDSSGFSTATTPSIFGPLFTHCTGLTDASNLILPATTLARDCYNSMFAGCESLTAAPELPATTLAMQCYTGMFSGCRSLTTAPELPATTLPQGCYITMFADCTSLTTAPELPATTLGDVCCEYMFNGCTSLTTAPTLPATTLTFACYRSMFRGCTSLTSAELPATTLAANCYQDMFRGCTSLTTAPALPATTLAGSCYYNMFYDCTGLTTAPALPATTLANSCYDSMFFNCRSLTNVPALSATTLADWCCNRMFSNCKSLTTAPELPATTLVKSCYDYMFVDCTNLNYIKCLATDISASNCTRGWVANVQTTSGTFVKNPAMSSWSTGNSGIPTNWTVQDAT